MGRLQRLREAWRGEKATTREIRLPDSLSAILGVGTGPNASTPTGAMQLYAQTTIASVPINWIAESLAVIEPVIRRGNDIEREHPVLDLLRRPSPYYTRELFIETLAKHYLIAGESPVIALGTVTQEPGELQPVSPAYVAPNEGSDGTPLSYTVADRSMAGTYVKERVKLGNTVADVRYYDGPLRELKVIRNFSTRNSSLLRGQSQMVPASAEARQHILGNEHNVSLLERGGKVSLLFHFKKDLDRDVFETLRERVHEAYGGPSKAGGLAVTAGEELDIKELGLTARDMDWRGIMDIARMAMALQYRVPLPLIFIDASTFNNYENAKVALYDDAILPNCVRIFGGLSDFLLPRFGEDDPTARISYDPETITPLVMRRLKELEQRRTINIETDNELRARAGLAPYKEGPGPGDRIRVTAGSVTLGNPSLAELELEDEGDDEEDDGVIDDDEEDDAE